MTPYSQLSGTIGKSGTLERGSLMGSKQVGTPLWRRRPSMNRLARSYLKALACCASTVIVSGLAVSQAHADSLPPTPAIGTVAERSQLPPSPPEIVSGALNSSTPDTKASPDAVVAVCDVFAVFHWSPKPHFAGRGVSECVNPQTDAPMSEEMEVEACLQFKNHGTIKNIECAKAGPTTVPDLSSPLLAGTCHKGIKYRTWAWHWVPAAIPDTKISETPWVGC